MQEDSRYPRVVASEKSQSSPQNEHRDRYSYYWNEMWKYDKYCSSG